MRKLLGGVILIAGIGGLGYWGAKDHASRMQSAIASKAGAAVSAAIHDVKTQVSGRDITITGLVNSENERETLIATLNDIEGRRVINDELKVLKAADPFTFAATRRQGETVVQGNTPTEEMRQILGDAGAQGTAGLVLASGAPDRWETAVGAGLTTLEKLDEGAFSIAGKTVRLSGVVDTPDARDQLLAALTLPEGYDLQSDIETRDDGAPVAFEIAYDAAQGVTVSGKLPNGLDLAKIGAALGVDSVSGDASAGLPGDPAATQSALERLKSWLPEFETLALNAKEGKLDIAGAVSPGANPDLLARTMRDDFGADVALDITELRTLPQSGATRTNVATGQAERFQNGFWLPDVVFTPSLEACGTQSEALLTRAKINFLSGSAELGPRALRAVNAMGAVVRRCVLEAGLVAELGGHTDNTGSNNFQLSAERAQAVLAAMVARGVPETALSAVGYGASKPIADNSTEAGRAANRRTTVRWAR